MVVADGSAAREDTEGGSESETPEEGAEVTDVEARPESEEQVGREIAKQRRPTVAGCLSHARETVRPLATPAQRPNLPAATKIVASGLGVEECAIPKKIETEKGDNRDVEADREKEDQEGFQVARLESEITDGHRGLTAAKV
jgi:hypothetical protein